MIIKTHISCARGTNGERPCATNQGGCIEHPRSQVDRLLNGGLEIPDIIYEKWCNNEDHKPFILVITGAPGTGKSTFALELAYRWAEKGHPRTTSKKDPDVALYTLYFSSESSGEILLKSKIRSFGWDASKFKLLPQAPALDQERGWVGLCGTDQLKDLNTQNVTVFLESLKDKWHTWLTGMTQAQPEEEVMRYAGDPLRPALVVVDSLNILEDREMQGEAFRNLVSSFEGGPLILAVILDTDVQGRHFWEYTADMVLKLERINLYAGPARAAYSINTFEICKGRWQQHALGLHQLKVFSRANPDDVHYPPYKKDKDLSIPSLPPYIDDHDGGVYVCESLHRQLSKRTGRFGGGTRVTCDPTPLEELNRIIGGGGEAYREFGGFPNGRCTAMVGVRGAMKSHLAYLWLLKREGQENSEKSLLISLRDDEAAAESRLVEIAKSELFYAGENPEAEARQSIEELLRSPQSLLRIVYFRPGYITPDEFLWRLSFHLDEFRPRRIVINAFEQLDAMFPLCAAQPSFVTGVVDMLCDQDRTSIAVAALSEGYPSSETGYGLLPVSDLVLRFGREAVPWESLPRDYRIEKYNEMEQDTPPNTIDETTIQVSRVPSGRSCGGRGILSLDQRNRLRFTPLLGNP